MQAAPFLRDELVIPPTKHMRMPELSLPASESSDLWLWDVQSVLLDRSPQRSSPSLSC